MTELSGPRVAAASGEARALVIFLHGYGADGNDLIGLAQPMAPHLPDVAFHSPDAPEPCSVNPMGRQWFPISFIDGSSEEEMEAGFRRAVGDVDAYIDAAMAAEGVGPAETALVGFSQGCMLALHVGLRRREALAGIVGFSGRLLPAEDPIVTRPPVLLVHGDADEVVPVQSLEEARAGLAAMDVSVRWHVSRGLGHGIDGEGLSLAVGFLKERLGAPPARG